MSEVNQTAAEEVGAKAEEAKQAGKGFLSKAGDAIATGAKATVNFFFGTPGRAAGTTLGVGLATAGVMKHNRGEMPYQQEGHESGFADSEMTGLIGD